MLSALVVATLLTAAPPAEARKESGFDAFGVPLLSFNSDTGVGFGAVGGAYLYSPGYRPYRHGLAAQTFFTTRGVQNHWLRYDGPRLLPRTRVEARLEWRRELFAPYYGPGNQASPEFPEDDFEDPFYSYDRISPGGWIRLRPAVLGPEHPFQPYVGYAYRWNDVRPYAQSLLEREAPRGLSGGPTGQMTAGVLWDTRDDESDTSRGGVEEISLRLSSPVSGSRYSFGGVTASERRFWPIGNRFVIAQRFTLDYLFGDVPFFEWPNIGGLQYNEGIGGMGSVRGVPRNRYSGNLKVLSNTEARFYVFEFQLFGEKTRAGGLVFADLGRTWHPGVPDGPWYDLHPGAGGGLRVVRRAAVVRFDYAVALENLRQGIYITFGQLF